MTYVVKAFNKYIIINRLGIEGKTVGVHSFSVCIFLYLGRILVRLNVCDEMKQHKDHIEEKKIKGRDAMRRFPIKLTKDEAEIACDADLCQYHT